MNAPIALGVLVATTLLLGSLAVSRSSRLAWLALAVAAIPLTSAIWWNLGETTAMLAGDPVPRPSLGQLGDKLVRILAGGVLPALAAWAILWRTPEDDACPCPRLCLQPWQRAGRAAAATLGLLAVVGAALLVLQGAGQRPALVAGHWGAVDPWLVLGLATSAAITEELLFRGVLYAFLARYIGYVLGAVLQAVAFAAIHIGYLDPWYVAGALGFGLFQAVASVRWGLLVAIAIHAQVNVVILAWSGASATPANEVLVLGALAFNVATLVIVWLATRTHTGDDDPTRPQRPHKAWRKARRPTPDSRT